MDCEPEVLSTMFHLDLPQAAPANLHPGKGQRGAGHVALRGSHGSWVPWWGTATCLVCANVCWGGQR